MVAWMRPLSLSRGGEPVSVCPKCGHVYTNSETIPSGTIFYHAPTQSGRPSKRCFVSVTGKGGL
jgi:hypothetical protein